MSAKGVLRTVKNYTKGYTPMQMKVREATSNDPGGPSGALMNEIAQATYNQADFLDVMSMLDKRLNDKGKNWRHVFKALTVLDYCLHVGSINVVHYSVDNIYIVKTLREFQYIDDSGRDQGANVRHKAKELTALLLDRSKLEEQRKNRNWVNSRFGFADMGMNMGGGGGGGGGGAFYNNNNYSGSSSRLPPRSRRDDRSGGHLRTNSLTNPNNRYGDDENEMRQALAESKRLSSSKHVPKNYDEDAELRKAIEESAREAKQEGEKNKNDGQGSNKVSGEVDLLGGFDDSLSMASGANNMNAMGSTNNLGGMNNNMSMMNSTSSFFQQQQQFGNNSSASNDLMGAFGGSGMNNGQMMGSNSANFDPFGLGNAGAMNTGMGMGMGMGMNMGMGSTNPYDNSMFNNSSNQFVSQTAMTTTSLALGGAGTGIGTGTGNVFGQTSGMGSSNLLASSGNVFGSGVSNNASGLLGGLQTSTGATSTGGAGAFDGASGAFGSAFDGGMAAKTLPFGVNPNDPNSKLAEIARNSERIDPFASLATGSSNNPFGSTGNASANNLLGNNSNNTSSFAGMASTPAISTTMDFMGTPGMSASSAMTGTPGLLGAGGSSLVDLSPAALATTSNTGSLQTFGQVNRNPFAGNGGSSAALSSFGNNNNNSGSGKQMSLNQMMSSNNNNINNISNTPTSMMGSSFNAFGNQQQQPNAGMSAFGGMQSQPMQQQQMVFQQQQFTQQQQQINPFSQGTANTNNNQNLFGL
ncbi:hypothetical protein LPJ64_000458 [Coemansia asiatica]|uniref:ENTH domain-containing protein n=1 Tax=Coemansia asiatica TaxID=1052880 RepID=A0A9W7XQT1_9FUNG|nr:hypothetical protein LPJ64_000458 [Coemansia asiatica]